ncbi:MAG: hypothetical protein J6V06_00355 [Clostridia bacterium]|nr:hypothetical protein [Clostridia bacterium]
MPKKITTYESWKRKEEASKVLVKLFQKLVGHRRRSAACGGLNKVTMAQRSKLLGAPSQ